MVLADEPAKHISFATIRNVITSASTLQSHEHTVRASCTGGAGRVRAPPTGFWARFRSNLTVALQYSTAIPCRRRPMARSVAGRPQNVSCFLLVVKWPMDELGRGNWDAAHYALHRPSQGDARCWEVVALVMWNGKAANSVNPGGWRAPSQPPSRTDGNEPGRLGMTGDPTRPRAESAFRGAPAGRTGMVQMARMMMDSRRYLG